MKISEILKSFRNKESRAETKAIILGDGGAEILGEGTYSDYENEREEVKTWRDYLKERFLTPH